LPLPFLIFIIVFFAVVESKSAFKRKLDCLEKKVLKKSAAWITRLSLHDCNVEPLLIRHADNLLLLAASEKIDYILLLN
jgi:hypothetical protein